MGGNGCPASFSKFMVLNCVEWFWVCTKGRNGVYRHPVAAEQILNAAERVQCVSIASVKK